MTRSFVIRVSLLAFVFTLLVLLAAPAPAASAWGPAPSGAYSVWYFNYVSDEGGAACPGGAVASSTDAALGTFHFWPEWTSPIYGVGVNNYTVCWDGWINFPSASNWFVQTINDDGMDIWVDGNITMRAWYDQGPTLHNGAFSVDPNVGHHVVIKYYNRTLGGTACVGWGVQGQAVSFWNCPSSQYIAPAPVYAPPYSVPYVPQYTPPYSVPYLPQYPQPYQPPQKPPYQPPQGHYPPGVPSGYCIYIVRPGDSLSMIAARFGVNYWTLAYWNHITNPSKIYSGTRLMIPSCHK